MPQEPKKKHSKGRKRTRRAAIMLKSLGIIKCKNCGAPAIPHQICPNCGSLGDKKVQLKTKATVTKA